MLKDLFDLDFWKTQIPLLRHKELGDFPDDAADLITFVQRGDRTTYQGPDKSYIVRWEGRWPDIKAKRIYLCLYVPDPLLEDIWANLKTWTLQVKKYGAYAVIGISYSVWLDDPLPVQLYNLWRIRFSERYLQDHGIRVIPTLIWGGHGITELSLSTLPPHIPAASIDMQLTVKAPLNIKLGFQSHAVQLSNAAIDSLLFWGVQSRTHKLMCLRYGIAKRHLFSSWGHEYRELLAQKRLRKLPMTPVQRKI